MKKIFVMGAIALGIYACGGADAPASSDAGGGFGGYASQKAEAEALPNDGKGIGEITHVELNNPLNQEMVSRGSAIYEMKCAACHKLTDQRVVGPGWAGVTTRRKPEWIMNMTTNVDVMLAEDPAAQAMLKECLVRMPNQNMSVGDARDILEFMYQNDAAK